MSQFDELMNLYQAEMKEMGISCDVQLLEKVAKGLGPSIYNNDASKVSSSDDEELARVDVNYLQKKLGLPASPDNMKAIKEVATTMGTGNKSKYRAIFYYLLCKKFGKESVYNS